MSRKKDILKEKGWEVRLGGKKKDREFLGQTGQADIAEDVEKTGEALYDVSPEEVEGAIARIREKLLKVIGGSQEKSGKKK